MNATQIGRLDLVGALTIRTIQDTYGNLRTALAQHDGLAVHVDAAAEFDLSLIQLLLAAKRSADKLGKPFLLAAPPPAPLRNALERAGFIAANSAEAAFWLKESGVQ